MKDTALCFELAIARVFEEGLKCSPYNYNQGSIFLGKYGDPAGMAGTSFRECLPSKYTVGYFILSLQRIIGNCDDNILKSRLGQSKETILNTLDNYLHQLEQYNCPDDYEKIINLFETIIDKYVFKHDPNSKDAFVLSGCCNTEEN
jgi:hypothetical protein